ncbi:MAG: bifunctional demethylmenaquinone methyltransferase/2-methoxy-6-polyprenyl-1,4-benzoquinol methylase UbiE [Bacteroidales bacterium]
MKKDAITISKMFDTIAPRYDLLNHIMSFNIDKIWRRKLIKYLNKKYSSSIETANTDKSDTDRKASIALNKKNNSKPLMLDLACGTGDVAFALAREGYQVRGVDISTKMLEVAKSKLDKINRTKRPIASGMVSFEEGSAEDIPYPDNYFDAVTIAFGIRNFNNRDTCIKEIRRVLKPGGSFAIIEFATPRNKLWNKLYTFYFKNILPRIGKAISGDNYAYTYLPESALSFPQEKYFCEEFEINNYKSIEYKSLTGGIAYLYTGEK